MKTIVAGSRDITDFGYVLEAVAACGWQVTEVVSGGARGVDRLGERFACENGLPIRLFPADWISHGRSAGIIRNKQMAEYADALIAVWDGKSPGTRHMIEAAQAIGLKVHIYKVEL